MKKAQTEMLGLVVIVIIIVIGALFYLKFVVLSGDNSDSRSKNIGAVQAYNLMNAVMNVNICGNISIRDGLVICRENKEICNENACSYLNKEIDSIVKSSINKDYQLNVNSSGWDYGFGGCKYGVTSYPYSFSVKGDSYRAIFKICDKNIA